jgi:signal transduction histidine kinase
MIKGIGFQFIMKRNWITVALTTFVVLIVAFLVVHLYSSSRRAVVTWFQEHQALHAHHFADEVETFLRSHSRGLLALSLFIPSQVNSLSWVKTQIETYSSQIQKDYTREIFLCDAAGRVIYSTHADAVGLDYGQSDFFAWAKKQAKKGEIFVSSLSAASRPPLVLLSIPLYQGSTGPKGSQKTEKFAGVISLKIDMEGFLHYELEEARLSLAQLWIMDTGGNLLFHSEHPEMTPRNIYQRDESCESCHLSFGYAEKILKKKEGTVDYKLKHLPKKLAAFSTAEFGNISWVVVVNFPYDKAVAFATKSLREHLTLLGIVVLAFVVSSTLILRNNRLKAQAETEAIHLQEKIAERKKAEEALYLERDKLKGILDSMQEGISIVDKQCDIQYINPVIEKEFGPINGRKCHEYFHAFPGVCSWCKNEGVFSGESAQWECYFRKNGKTYEITEVPMSGSEEVVSKLEIFHDVTERKKAEGVLRDLERYRRNLSFQLLMAQETERRRVSRELHDELGGALAVFKLRLSYIEKHLEEEQKDLKKECRYNLSYIDQVIENVHRLSRDLSPSILEDLGLSSALRWLITNFGKNYSTKMISDVIDIDHLFPQSTQIVVYRIVQEALTNIGKHSEAKTVSLVVKRDDSAVSFSVEDDGKGFDVRKAIMKDAGERGLGLPSMDERARMLGGSLDVWSEEAKGTRITVRIPIEKKGIV